MIAPDHLPAALKALHSLLVSRRNEALDRDDAATATFFDMAEYLPCLMLEADDQTARFESHLRGWAGSDLEACRAYNLYLHALGREQADFDELAAESAAARTKLLAKYGPPPDAAPRRSQGRRMTRDQKPSAASPATLDAIRHLARLGVRGWVLIALLLGAVYLADRYLLDSPAAPAPSGDGGSLFADADAPVPPPRDRSGDDFGPDPQTPPRDRTPGARPAEPPRRTYAVVTVRFRTKAGEGAVDLEPGAVLARADGKGLVLSDRLRGGETLTTNCGDAATVLSAKAVRVENVRRPPRCAPAAVEPLVERVTVENFGRPVPAATEDGVVDLSATLERIATGRAFPHRNDGSTFGNRERRLPNKPRGYYTEYVHPTRGVGGPGPQRIVLGKGGEVWYTPDHYESFRAVAK